MQSHNSMTSSARCRGLSDAHDLQDAARFTQVGLTDDVPLKYPVTIREICTTVKKAEVSLIHGHQPHPCFMRRNHDGFPHQPVTPRHAEVK